MVEVALHGFSWRHAGRASFAVRDVDLRVEHGERVLLLGASGAGKSTLLAALAGLLPLDSGEQLGEVLIDGRAAVEARDRVGIVFQDPETQIVMQRAGDDVAFGLENRGVPRGEIWPRVDAALSTVGFGYGRDRDTTALSGGEQQRLALAGALASRPGLLLLDEPTANLDPRGAASVRDTLRNVLDETQATMVLVEHRVTEALPLVDRIVVLAAGGGVLADGPAAQVCERHGDFLDAQGIWVPGYSPESRVRAASAGEALIAAKNLTIAYPDAARPAVAEVDLTVHAGQITAVLGDNGSGKSTLAMALGGLTAPTAGRVVAMDALTVPGPAAWAAEGWVPDGDGFTATAATPSTSGRAVESNRAADGKSGATTGTGSVADEAPGEVAGTDPATDGALKATVEPNRAANGAPKKVAGTDPAEDGAPKASVEPSPAARGALGEAARTDPAADSAPNVTVEPSPAADGAPDEVAGTEPAADGAPNPMVEPNPATDRTSGATTGTGSARNGTSEVAVAANPGADGAAATGDAAGPVPTAAGGAAAGNVAATRTGRRGWRRVRGPKPPHKWRAQVLSRRIGSVFQNPEHQFVTATVYDELALGPRAAGLPEAAVRSRVEELLERLRLKHVAQANPFTLSGGEARRLSVATALSNAPRLLIMDEPTFGQDRRTWDELVDLIVEQRDQGAGIVAVTHDPHLVACAADREVHLDAGRLT